MLIRTGYSLRLQYGSGLANDSPFVCLKLLFNHVMSTDPIEGFGNGGRRRSRLLSRLECDDLRHKHRRRSPIDASSRADDSSKCTRNKEPQRDTLRPREHQSLHAGRL